MEITAETLSKNTKEYQIYDIRGEVDRLYGIIPGSFAATEESIFSCLPEEKHSRIHHRRQALSRVGTLPQYLCGAGEKQRTAAQRQSGVSFFGAAKDRCHEAGAQSDRS